MYLNTWPQHRRFKVVEDLHHCNTQSGLGTHTQSGKDFRSTQAVSADWACSKCAGPFCPPAVGAASCGPHAMMGAVMLVQIDGG